jgi:hypothetical protein
MQRERDRLFEEAVRANNTKSEFLANMSHEIRTPLNAILGLNYLIENTNLDETQKDYIKKIEHSAQLLLKQIHDLLDFSKIESGELTFNPAPFNLSDTLKDLVDIMNLKSREKGLRLNISLDEKIPDTLIGDQFRLEQVLMNLINNAIKFTEKGEVNVLVSPVSGSETSAGIKFSVMDTGIGLTEEQKKKLFKPFTQADASTTRKFGGTGLGLSISQSLVKLLGGKIDVESEINRGSTFFFTLNFRIGRDISFGINETDGENHEYEIEEEDNIKDKCILIVDDNKINQHVTREILDRINANTAIAGNGQEAVDFLSENKNTVNLILMDLQMPVLDGFNATIKIREMGEYKNIPIIALTADVMPDSRSRIFEVGMNDILLKPISPESLYRKVYQWTGIKNSKTDDNKNINIDFSPLSSSVNIKDGLHYASNNEELYCRLLFMFLDSHGDFIENFAETIKDKDTVSAARQMHTLKGTSGTLGMTGLHKVAEDIEEEIKNGKGDEALNNLPLKLENNLKPVLNAICEFRKKINNKKEK